MSTVVSSIFYVVQQQPDHCCMGQTPCGEGFVGINAVSSSISVTAKQNWASSLTSLHIAWEENAMSDIPSCLFESDPSSCCENYTDLLNLFNKNQPLPNQAVWNVFSTSSAVSTKVISVLRMKHFEMGVYL